MGGQIPRSIDVYNPRLRARVTIDLPFANDTVDKDLYRLFDRENVLNLCMDLLRKIPDWKYLLERAVREDERRGLQLAWRNELSLDWVWLDRDVCGEERPWAVACGLALKQVYFPSFCGHGVSSNEFLPLRRDFSNRPWRSDLRSICQRMFI